MMYQVGISALGWTNAEWGRQGMQRRGVQEREGVCALFYETGLTVKDNLRSKGPLEPRPEESHVNQPKKN